MTDSKTPATESQGHSDLGIPRELQSPAPRTGRQMTAVNLRWIATAPETRGICNRR